MAIEGEENMRQTWRWFGPKDLVSVDDMMQAGVEGRRHVAGPGGGGPGAEVVGGAAGRPPVDRLGAADTSGRKWDVVESRPMSEDIKRQKGDWKAHITAYKQSLANLAAAGIEVVCYNVMPVLDWTRTDLAYRLANGATCMRFDLIDFAAFDIHILERPGASEDFPEEVAEEARRRFADMSDARRSELARNAVFGLPGAAENFTLEDVRRHLAEYAGMSGETLRAHLVDFLSEVAPVAQKLGVRMCCHPDDPPFPLLGLPRVMSTEADYRTVMEAVDIPANGITLCSGSLGSRPDNDLPGMMDRLGDRVHFLHLRNVRRESGAVMGSFYEAEHLGGGTDMVALIAAVLRQERKRRAAGRTDVSIPMRPDHGQDILDDHKRKTQPGYPSIGRLKGLAELRGIMTALDHPVEGLPR